MSLGLQWTCKGFAMGLQWACNRLATDMQWICNGLTIGLQWVCNRLAMGMQWICNGFERGLQGVCIGFGFAMGLQGVCNGLPRFPTVLQWACNGRAMGLQWAYNELAMGLQCLLPTRAGQATGTSQAAKAQLPIFAPPHSKRAGRSRRRGLPAPRDAPSAPRAVAPCSPAGERFGFTPLPRSLLRFPRLKEKQLRNREMKGSDEAEGGWKNPATRWGRTPKVRWLRGAAAGDAQGGGTAR